ncbi:hypothetical protein [Streptomyces clavuligerus]|uniref:hypothetical protein n=1 Tax=Streptomyces clavuligerus TaxID=1901 RepID=UPI00018520DF|nr:hypothetical protein [Streptomyces clavuligerus]MBY6306546.1 hypothetical protein [Streptomyces clavuligerus]QPJ97115.1 hypothetical protein GE265_28790 [Streptomyces clavuligerus]
MLRSALVKTDAVAALSLGALGAAHGARSESAENHSSTTAVTVVAYGPGNDMIWG